MVVRPPVRRRHRLCRRAPRRRPRTGRRWLLRYWIGSSCPGYVPAPGRSIERRSIPSIRSCRRCRECRPCPVYTGTTPKRRRDLVGEVDRHDLAAYFAHALVRKNHKGKPTVSALAGSYAVLRDLMRLAVFPPEPGVGTASPNSTAARYFLHVYEGSHKDHLAFDTNVGKKIKGKTKRDAKPWLEHIHSLGTSTFNCPDFKKEPKKFALGTNGAAYALYLTRVEGFSVEFAGNRIEVGPAGCVENPAGAWASLRTALDQNLAK